MNIQTVDPIIVRKLGLEALTKTLGPVGMVRFLQQFEAGAGNYTKEREHWLKGLDVKTIIKEIKAMRK
ncbi:MAG: hypothetical protein A3G39_03710 [Deltaproteobacteria bacterium RIFCSPLOWO2_12_FULL_43_16]|nr:MAG: hypothetical protein A2Z89_06010 [Deltaproteobacteria bacterium GWA2_43_19]OGQ10178.1 MAG: hypothetical protein A3D30_00220 [Deltaproteobacteria bacterium RIFCSPHIGHO2_02_FULL_43_33]OGQ58872.1 MAG: hypothetical protein A3G39_03710 [Deltaproteobacteria bacterium RIFCSPLOWO2_12_FULL_43_16]HBR17390.1 hypothetical protein [Deltaproteobacteria bacterium]